MSDLDVTQDQKSKSTLTKEAIMVAAGIVAFIGILYFLGKNMAMKEKTLKGIA